MLTAHLPAAYCLARPLRGKARWILPAALLGAVLPDFDLLAFYFLDDAGIHHHRYWVHIPAFWALMAVIGIPAAGLFGLRRAAMAFLASIVVHLVLDTIGGGIMWGAPVDDRLRTLVTVPATQSHYILSFIMHWTFLLELSIWAAFALTWRRAARS